MPAVKSFLLLLFVFFLRKFRTKNIFVLEEKKAKTNFTITAAFYECVFLIK